MLKTLVEGLFSTSALGPQFLVELIAMVLVLEFIRALFDFVHFK